MDSGRPVAAFGDRRLSGTPDGVRPRLLETEVAGEQPFRAPTRSRESGRTDCRSTSIGRCRGRLSWQLVPAQVGCGVPRSIGHPPRRHKQVSEHRPHVAGTSEVARKSQPRRKFDAQRVVAGLRLDEAVSARQIFSLRDIRAKQSIEDYQYAPEVRVQVGGVRSVVHPVRRRRVEHVFDPT